MKAPRDERGEGRIAIVGLACRVPGAADPAALWRRLRAGDECISFCSAEELLAAGVPRTLLQDPRYVPAHGRLDGADGFDAAFFGFSAREARITDPQQRLFLECCWEALEDAGQARRAPSTVVGVYGGAGLNTYLRDHVCRELDPAQPGAAYQAVIANDKDFLASRVAHRLDLRGPAVTLQTACSTSLVAVHVACQALLDGECDLALAGGVSVRELDAAGYLYEEGMILSPDGHCRAFDAAAAGTVAASGVGVAVLKRLREARDDGDRVRAVILGSAINNDGGAKVGFTAPSVAGQAAVISEALAVAGVAPETVTYVEAHGTGTALGDPIEVAALQQVFGNGRAAAGSCALGSVKTNLGHLDTAAGIAGLIKVVLALEHREIPPSLHFRRPNPRIDFTAGPFAVNAELRPWPGPAPRRAGVSSFGLGGTNAHVVVEEAPLSTPGGTPRAVQVVVLSAKTPSALAAARARLGAHLERPEAPPPLADVAHTLQVGRAAFRHRWAALCRSGDELVAACNGAAAGGTPWSAQGDAAERPLAFLFPGQLGRRGVGRALYAAEPELRRAIDEAAGHLGGERGEALRGEAVTGEAALEWVQPGLFLAELALARLWASWGIEPEAVAGHGVGEYAAATLAGVLTWQEALDLLIVRGRLMAALPCCEGFHSALVEPVLGPFGEHLGRLRPRPPRRRWISMVTGLPVTAAAATDPAYWLRQMRAPVRFGAALDGLFVEPHRVLLEVGPDAVLTSLARRHPHRGDDALVESSLPRWRPAPGAAPDATDPQEHLLGTLARLWLAGASVDWPRFGAAEQRRLVGLPTYPFERRPHRWPAAAATAARQPLGDWSYVPSWRRGPPPAPAGARRPRRWLVLADEGGVGAALAALLGGRGDQVLTVRRGEGLRRSGPLDWEIDPRTPAGFDDLFGALGRQGWQPDALVHCWQLASSAGPVSSPAPTGGVPEAFAMLADLLRACARTGSLEALELTVVANGLAAVADGDELDWSKATLLSALRVLRQEHPGARCQAIDLEPSTAGETAQCAAALLAELDAGGDGLVALRGRQRWLESWERMPLPAARPAEGLRPRGVYLVIGGLGTVGFALASELAGSAAARLVITGRSAVAAGADAGDAGGEAGGNARCSRLRALARLGGEVLYLQADVADEAAMTRALRLGEARFGTIDGIVHAAGETGLAAFAPLASVDRRLSRRHFDPKLGGAAVLARLLAGRQPDFILLCSSLAAVVGGVGYLPYTAANLALDAAVESLARATGQRWLSIGWDGWWRGDAGGRDGQGSEGSEGSERWTMTPEEGVEVFRRLLAARSRSAHLPPRLLVSTLDLPARARRAAAGAPAVAAAAPHRAADRVAAAVAASASERPPQAPRYVAPHGDSERTLAAIWSALLGVREVGADDDFLALGGDSLLAVQVISRLRAAAGVELPLQRLLGGSSLATLAQELDALRARSAPVGDSIAADRVVVDL